MCSLSVHPFSIDTKQRATKKKVVVRKPPSKVARLRLEKLFEDEKHSIDDVEDSFSDYTPKISTLYGLRRLCLETFRAVRIGDERLMKMLMKDKQNVANPWINWSVNVQTNCLDAAIESNNIAMVETLLKLKRYSKYASNRVALPQSGRRLKLSSGHTGSHTFGHKVRAVKASRGGKEGNNAFTKDDVVKVRSLQDHFDLAMIQGNWDMVELLLKELHRSGLYIYTLFSFQSNTLSFSVQGSLDRLNKYPTKECSIALQSWDILMWCGKW